MSHLSLPLKYRPQRLQDIVGQDCTANALTNAILAGRVRQAYLFSGQRGTGKTSCARVFAKSLNCLTSDAETIKPCLTCRSCVAAHTGDDVSIIEIDGASNNKVDDARALIEEAHTFGLHGRFKIYIIDEVHMLTKQAFNALLKTLEEPPSHVKFILCTTELDRVLKTIRSRCQHFLFHPIDHNVAADQLDAVMEQEEIIGEEGVTLELAKMSNGSLRDSLTLLDQVINTENKKLTLKTLQEFFGKPSKKYIQNILKALSCGDTHKTASSVKWLASRGFGEYYVVTTLISALQDIIPSRLKEPNRLEVIVDIILELEALSRVIRSSDIPGALFEATLLKIALNRRQ